METSRDHHDDYSTDIIDDHADGEDPFFIYMIRLPWPHIQLKVMN